MTHNRRIAPILPLLGRLVIRSITVQAPWSYGPLKPCTLWNTLNFTLKYSLWNCKRRRVFSEDSRRVALVAKPTWHRLAHCKRYQFQNSNKFFKTAEYSTRERERTKVCFGLPPLSPLLYSSSYGGSIAIDLVGCFFANRPIGAVSGNPARYPPLESPGMRSTRILPLSAGISRWLIARLADDS